MIANYERKFLKIMLNSVKIHMTVKIIYDWK